MLVGDPTLNLNFGSGAIGNRGGSTIVGDGTTIGYPDGNRVNGDIRTGAIQSVSGTVAAVAVGNGLPPGFTAAVNGKTAVADFILTSENR